MNKNINVEQLCDVIKNLRLFTNTEQEWKEKYASLYKPGQKDKLFDLLDAQCRKDYDGLELSDFMDDYSKSSKNAFLDKHKRDVIFTNEDNLLTLVRHFCMPGDTQLPERMAGRKDIIGFQKCDVALLLLWSIVDHERHTKALPFFDERTGDVDISSYGFIISELRRLLSKVFPKKVFVTGTPPVIISEFRKIQTKLHNRTIIRMDLVALVINVLGNIITIKNRDELYACVEEMNAKYAVTMDISDEDDWWIDPDKAPVKQLYKFEECGSSYSLITYNLENHTYSDTTVTFFRKGEDSIAVVLSPTSTLHLVRNEPLAEGTFMYCNCESLSDDDRPDALRLHPYSGSISSFPCTLKRISVKTLTSLIPAFTLSRLDDFDNKYPDYEYDRRNVERLISADYIFVEKSCVTQPDGSSQVSSWYRLSRYDNPDWNLHLIKPEDYIFHIHLFGEDYLFFDMLNLSLKVTTEQDCEKLGIEITTKIELRVNF